MKQKNMIEMPGPKKIVQGAIQDLVIDVVTDNATPASATRDPAVTRRILLVDDEPAILLTLKAILEMNDFEVVTAASCAEAKLRLEEDSYHLVITDLKMEKENSGFDVVRFARKQQYRPAVAILSARADLGDWKAQDGESFWTKPVSVPELLEGIKAFWHDDNKEEKPQLSPKAAAEMIRP